MIHPNDNEKQATECQPAYEPLCRIEPVL